MDNKFDALKLGNQLCFPLYVCSKEIVKRYKPFLDEIGLTYTQYITMMAVREHEELSVKELGELLFLDSGTLTPVLKLKEQAVEVPFKMQGCMLIDEKDAAELCRILHTVMENISLDK